MRRFTDRSTEPRFQLKKKRSLQYFSTSPSQEIVAGLSQLPVERCKEEGRPLLIVGNHQYGGLDVGLFAEELLRVKGVLPRGLAHPVIFRGGQGQGTDQGAGQGMGGQGGKSQMSYFEGEELRKSKLCSSSL